MTYERSWQARMAGLEELAERGTERGPHAPSVTCPRCRDLFGGDPPVVAVDPMGGWTELQTAIRAVFATVEHRLGYSSFRLVPGMFRVRKVPK